MTSMQSVDSYRDEIVRALTPLPADPACTRGCIGVYASDDDD